MSQVRIKENESLENALRRFKRATVRDGVIQEVRKREHYEKPSVKRKKNKVLCFPQFFYILRGVQTTIIYAI